jgi:hypothetical protein
MKEVIRATIKKDGTIQLAVEGVTGKSCVGSTEQLEVFLGKSKEKEMTADYYKPEPKEPETWIKRG